MKKVILFLFFVPATLFSQVTDNFESGKLNKWVESVAGHWKADSLNPLSGKYSLHHVFDNQDAGTDQVAINIADLKPAMGVTKWSFRLRHGYDPSSSNNWGVFLTSDAGPVSMIPSGIVNGFVIGVNLAGYDDTLRLWKVRKGSFSPVIASGINWQNDIGTGSAVKIDVERSTEGSWKIRVFSGGQAIADSVFCFDNELFVSEWFGVFYRYTSTRDRLLWIDDVTIDGVFYEDKEPPEVKKCAIYTPNSLDITLDEEPGTGFFEPGNFTINNSSSGALSVMKLNPFSIRIYFEEKFTNKSMNTLLIRSVCDKSGNCRQNLVTDFTPVWAEPGDIIISEIMADPVPSVSLPEKEYLEIFNRSDFQFNLKNWKLAGEGTGTTFPEFVINPDERIILCQSQDTLLFSKYGRVKGLKSFPSLTDGGRLVSLTDSSSMMIHGVEYNSEWYGDNIKKEGGWSLEMIDTKFPFFAEGNWTASQSKTGGTPGRTNSVNRSNPDLLFTGLINAFPNDSGYLDVLFSEPVRDIGSSVPEISINETPVQSASILEPLMREFLLKPSFNFTGQQQYSLTIPETVRDFAGNRPEKRSFSFGIPEKVTSRGIVFNEILFNPYPGEADYIELFNDSQDVIDASELLLVSVNDAGISSPAVPVSLTHRCILPGTYYATTIDRISVLARYFSAVPENIFTVYQLPSMPDDKGHLVLYNRQLDIIDEVAYNDKMHFPLLSGYEGIALEKVRPSVQSYDPANWHSASESSGWGTPGAPNSIYSPEPQVDDRVVFSSKRITPDNDGNEDLLVIDLKLEGIGNVVTISIFDETGNYLRKLADNLLAGPNASITWDATAENGSIVNSGIYIILISVFDETGKSKKWKKVCAVVR